ncbi:11507_t:CDS:10 [Diversispora eburnea]|uniref:Vacuolar protein-sorting-associated protein 36 n=1 Tax=Diversispora eburnea TaxID=1213867 RepID=A0A9N8YLV7_9GLOM|nr:11507_t:CDS:10 [Diversispora eburnea]
MNRFTRVNLTSSLRPVLAGNETVIATQDNVGLYDGNEKTSDYTNGIVYLTSHRIVYVDEKNPTTNSVAVDIRLIKDRELYVRKRNVEQQFSTPSSNPTDSIEIACPLCTFLNHPSMINCELCDAELGTINMDGLNMESDVGSNIENDRHDFVKLSFRRGNSTFYDKLKVVMSTKEWEKTDESQAEQSQKEQDETLNQAFKDLDGLMANVTEVVRLAESIKNKISKDPEFLADETSDFRTYLVELGIQNPVTKDSAGSVYHKELARQLAEFLEILLVKENGMIALTDIYCIFNRARGVCNDEQTAQRIIDFIKDRESLTAIELASLAKMSVVLAIEQLQLSISMRTINNNLQVLSKLAAAKKRTNEFTSKEIMTQNNIRYKNNISPPIPYSSSSSSLELDRLFDTTFKAICDLEMFEVKLNLKRLDLEKALLNLIKKLIDFGQNKKAIELLVKLRSRLSQSFVKNLMTFYIDLCTFPINIINNDDNRDIHEIDQNNQNHRNHRNNQNIINSETKLLVLSSLVCAMRCLIELDDNRFTKENNGNPMNWAILMKDIDPILVNSYLEMIIRVISKALDASMNILRLRVVSIKAFTLTTRYELSLLLDYIFKKFVIYQELLTFHEEAYKILEQHISLVVQNPKFFKWLEHFTRVSRMVNKYTKVIIIYEKIIDAMSRLLNTNKEIIYNSQIIILKLNIASLVLENLLIVDHGLRTISNLYYRKGVYYYNNNQIKEAIKPISESCKILNQYIQELQSVEDNFNNNNCSVEEIQLHLKFQKFGSLISSQTILSVSQNVPTIPKLIDRYIKLLLLLIVDNNKNNDKLISSLHEILLNCKYDNIITLAGLFEYELRVMKSIEDKFDGLESEMILYDKLLEWYDYKNFPIRRARSLIELAKIARRVKIIEMSKISRHVNIRSNAIELIEEAANLLKTDDLAQDSNLAHLRYYYLATAYSWMGIFGLESGNLTFDPFNCALNLWKRILIDIPMCFDTEVISVSSSKHDRHNQHHQYDQLENVRKNIDDVERFYGHLEMLADYFALINLPINHILTIKLMLRLNNGIRKDANNILSG